MRCILIVAFATSLAAQTAPGGESVLLIVNRNSDISLRIGEMYARRRGVPAENVCRIRAPSGEQISRQEFADDLEAGVLRCLERSRDRASILYLLTTKGVPLRIGGDGGRQASAASVDSELALAPRRLRGERISAPGRVENPYFMRYRESFEPERHDFYPVTRLTGYSYEDVEGLVSRSLEAKNRGVFVLDQGPIQEGEGNDWMSRAARALSLDRVFLDKNNEVVYGMRGVIGYASWGSNDVQRQVDKRRFLGFEWAPGALAIEYVSTNGRTFREPPKDWTIGTWRDESTHFFGSPQSMTGDLVREGAAGVAGHVYEPYLDAVPRPDYVLPKYYSGATLAEAFYVGIPYLSWMNIVVGDPLCRIGPAER